MRTLEGNFIVFEGTDGVGKSTQVDMLSTHLEGMEYDVLKLTTPGSLYRSDPHVQTYNQTGSGLLRPTTLAVMSAADRLRTYDTEIKPHLDNGGVVVCDRYKFSAEAYFNMRGADIPLLREIHTRLPNPDYAILLTIDATTRLARLKTRGTTDDWEERDMAYQDTVQAEIVSRWNNGYKIIDAAQPVDAISREIKGYLKLR